ncbi:MAG: penicillin acylase family protein [Kangiellaceae bacterium]
MLKKTLVTLVTLLLTLFALSFFYIKMKAPLRDGNVKLQGLSDNVSVLYDRYGIPHINAKNDADLYRVFGYVHAQDRLFQMEMLRRLSQGKLAEVYGEKLVDVDKLFRTLGLESYAKDWLLAIEKRGSKKLLKTLDNYLAGVNEFVNTGSKPIEFELLNFPKHHYTREDIASIAGYMAFSFAFAIKDDALVDYIYQKLGNEYLSDLAIDYTPGFKQILVDPVESKLLSQEVTKIIEKLTGAPLFHGSNSWLVGPSKSASGRAMLVNDPHIGYSQPSVWYEAQLKSDATNIYGHFIALTPMPQLGFNKEIAWGLTMFENDDMDLYAEKINPKNVNQYWAIDQWKNFDQRIEKILVKDGETIDYLVKESRHGSIINSIYHGNKKLTSAVDETQNPIALWWAFKNTDNLIMEGFYDLPHAKTIADAEAVAAKIYAPGLNLMFATSKGDIAWWASAKLPIRPAHVNSKMILDGASGKDDILGFYDFKFNPKRINPKEGVLYSANNQTADMGNGLVPGYYAPTDRPSRITEMLASSDKLSVDFMKEMLIDSQSKTGMLFQETALPILKNNDKKLTKLELTALNIYEKWDGNHLPEQTGASINNRFRMSLIKLAMEDELGKKYFPNFQFSFLVARSIWRILPNEKSVWWDNINTQAVETREQLILKAWTESVSFLQNKYGNDIESWTWENEASVTYEHPLGTQAPFDTVFNVGPYSTRQGMETINNTRLKQVGDDLKITMGPSTRRVIDFGDIENSWGILPTGQSGVLGDPHYDDQAEDYSLGKFRHQFITEEKVLNNLEGKIIFSP